MTNDSVHIKCKACGGWKMLFAHFPTYGLAVQNSDILEWLGDHASCHPRSAEVDLGGDPGFELHTDDAVGGALLLAKQNYAPPT